MRNVGIVPQRAELLTVRLITVLIAFEAFLEAFAVLPFHLSGESRLEPYRIATSVLVGIGIPLFGGLVAFKATLRSLRVVNGATAIGHIMVLTGWIFLIPESNRGLNVQTLWILASGPAIAAAIIAWGLGWGWFVFTVTAIGFPIAQYLDSESFSSPEAVIDSLKTMVFSLGTAAAVSALINSAKLLDIKAQERRASVQQMAVSVANTKSRQQTELLIHDDILSTLTFASSKDPELLEVIASQARNALKRIDEMSHKGYEDEGVSLNDFLDGVKKLVDDATSPVTLIVQISSDFYLPGDVAESLLGALAQAIRNSLDHAKPVSLHQKTVSRQVRVTSIPNSIEIEIQDDGQGFVRDAIPEDRLGIRNSIYGRMDSLRNGAANISSSPGAGTTVILSWKSDVSQSGLQKVTKPPSIEFGYDHRGIVLIGIVYIACHLIIAGIRLSMGAPPVSSIITLVALSTAMVLLAINGSKKLTLKSAYLLVSLTLLAPGIQLIQPLSDEAPRLLYWYLPGVAGILVLLVLKNRAILAWVTLAVILGISVMSAKSYGLLTSDFVQVLLRPLLMLGMGTLFLLALTYFQKALARLRTQEDEMDVQKIFNKTTRMELKKNSDLLKKDAGALLLLLSKGEKLTEEELMSCITLEGQLRDETRGHRLTRDPLMQSTHYARMRGIEVVLLDDGGNNPTLENHLDQILIWMSKNLETMLEGKFTGRILPEGRSTLATIVMENEARETQLYSFESSSFRKISDSIS